MIKKSGRQSGLAGNFHETYDRPELSLPSDRSTGLVFAAIALVIAYIWRSNGTVLIMALAVAAALAAVSLTAPPVLPALNVAWMRIAHLISKVMNPIVMLI